MGKNTKVSRESLRDQSYHGEDYLANQELLNGPLSNRKCTDCLFLVLFLAFFGLLIYITSESVEKGNPQQLITPVDYNGKLCGLDREGYDYLYYIIEAKQQIQGVANTTEAASRRLATTVGDN